MILLKLAIKSINNRISTTALTVLSISLSVVLLLSVERTKRAAEEGFTNAVSKADLLVGARTGPINLILYTVFNMGSATNNIAWDSYEKIKNLPEVDWTIPYSLGDGHRGYRVVATDENFYKNYRFRGDNAVEFAEGGPALGLWDVAVGSEVARKLDYKMGDRVIVAHGVTRGEGVQKHEDKPFVIKGILKPTGTAIDQTLYISLFGMEAIHIDWKSGAAPTKGNQISADKIRIEDIKIDQLTSFFVRTKSRIETLSLQRSINDFDGEPLLAIIPGSTLSDLWRGLSQIDVVLRIISMMVLAIGLAAMISSLIAGLNERRREMAILRSIGASPLSITALMVFESSLLTFGGIVLGLVLQLSGFFLLSGWIEAEFGFYLVGSMITYHEILYLVVLQVCGIAAGLIPAIKATQFALKDGLTAKT